MNRAYPAGRQLLSLVVLLAAMPAFAGESALWGKSGERWDPRGRLPDFSYAGYHAGEKAIPDVPVVTNVRDFGAVGDGVIDDTDAFKAALKATRNGACLAPAGRYVINDVLIMNTDGVVLRGEGSGPDGTVLHFPRHLTDVTGRGPKPWEYGYGGLVWIGKDHRATGKPITEVTATAVRGDTKLAVADADGLAAGQYVVLTLRDADGPSLIYHMHNDQADPDQWSRVPRGSFEWPVRIGSVAGNTVTLAQPLRIDARLEWKPTLRAYNPVQEIGMEHLRLEFPDRVYRGHHQELGYNGFGMSSALNCWARDITVKNGENVASVGRGSKHCELQTIRYIGSTEMITTPGPDQGLHGHHGVSFANCADCLLTGYEGIDPTCHDITVCAKANGNVVRRSVGLDLSLDHHRGAPLENLFTDINAGRGVRLYMSSGSAGTGPHAGARETFWNIRSSAWDMPGAPVEFQSWGRWTNYAWDHMQTNVIPCATDIRTTDRQWQETVADLEPADLYAAQLARRLGAAVPRRTVADAPVICPQKGAYVGGARVTLLTVTRGGRIHYTLDGSEPTEASPRFTERFVLKRDATLAARTYCDGLTPSEVATQTFAITPDDTPTTVETIMAAADPEKVVVCFSEEVDAVTAGEASRYHIDGGARVLAARAEPNSRMVTLTTSPMTDPGEYALTIRGVQDRWANPTAEGASYPFRFTQPAPALLAHYRFDGDAADCSGNGFTAQMGSATFTPDGHRGGAARLDGKGDYIALPPALLDDVADFTFAAWVLTDSADASVHLFDFNVGVSGPGRGAYMYLAPSFDANGAVMRITLGGIVHDEGIRAAAALPVGRWFHVALTLAGDVATLYVDGKPLATDAATLNPRDLRATALWLGRNVYPDSRTFHGRLDDVRIYNHALGEGEIGELVTPDPR